MIEWKSPMTMIAGLSLLLAGITQYGAFNDAYDQQKELVDRRISEVEFSARALSARLDADRERNDAEHQRLRADIDELGG